MLWLLQEFLSTVNYKSVNGGKEPKVPGNLT